MKNGYRGFLAFSGGELAGYWWWVSAEADAALTHPCIHRLELDLRSDELYGFDYFIAPEYRDHGLAVKCLALMYRELRNMGYRTVWAYVDASNTAARWVYQSLGNRVVKRVTSHEVLSVLLFQDRRVFLRNSRRNLTHGFDRRMVASWRTHVPKRPRAA
jgi:RimJ/RimL family protein N-acetyltransferase